MRVLDCARHPWILRYRQHDLNRLWPSGDILLELLRSQWWMGCMEDCFFVTRSSRMDAIKAYILAKIDDPNLCLADIAAHQGISSSYVRKLFAAEGAKFSAYVLEIRLEKVSRMLADPDLRLHSISAVALMCGFNDVSYFNRAFRKRYGCTPSDLRSGRQAPHSGPERDGTTDTPEQP